MSYVDEIQKIFNITGCPHYSECIKNIEYNKAETACKFRYDRAKIGENYGANGIPKIVMVGIEGFSSEKTITKVIQPALNDTVNPHYNGVKYVLAYLLADFFNKDKPASRITNNSVEWIDEALKSYTLCNLFRCAFVPANDPQRIKGLKHSEEMQKNCIEILIKELRVLEPDIVVIQATDGSVFTGSMQDRLFNEFKCKIKSGNDKRARVLAGVLEDKQCLFVQTLHGANGGFKSHKYLDDELNPILDKTINMYKETV